MPKRPERGVSSVCLACLLPTALLAASPVFAAKPLITYRASLQETLTDNAGAGTSGTDDEESDLITSATLGVNGRYKGGHVEGQLSLSGTSRSYLEDQSRNNGSVQGSGRLSVEAIDDRLFFDAGGTVSQREESSFGRSSVDDSIDTGNRTTVRTWFTSARSSFQVGREIQGTAALRRTWTSGGSEVLDGRRINTALTAGLENPLAYGPLGWQLAFQRQLTDGDARTGTADLQTIRGTASYRQSPQLSWRLIGGRESNNYENGFDQDYYIRGVGADWVLSPRTRLNATVEKRFFGTGYNYQFAYSRPRSSLRASYVRDVSSIEDSTILSLEEIAFREFFVSLASSIPDEAQRAEVARGLAASLPNGSSTFASFVTNSFSVSRSLQLSGSLVGARNVVSFGFTQSDSERIGTTEGLSPGDDFSRFSNIKTTSLTTSWSHKVSGRSNLSAGISHSRSEGSGASSEDVTRRSLTVGYNTRIGTHTNGALTVRRQQSEGSTEFTEHAIVASLTASF